MMNHYKAFLRAWLDFAENHDNNPMGFIRRHGLCSSAWCYAVAMGLSQKHQHGIDEILAEQLEQEFGDSTEPFNKTPDVPEYTREPDKTKNPYRLAFVRKELGL